MRLALSRWGVMRTVGLLISPAETFASLVVGGITVAERQARQWRRAGVETLLMVDPVPLTLLPTGTETVTTAALAQKLEPGDRVMVISSGVVIDERAITAMLAAPMQSLLVRDAALPGAGGVERLDALAFAAGLMVLPGAMVRRIAAEIGEWDLESTLIRIVAADSATTRIEFSAIPVYAPARRRVVPLIWARPETPAQARDAGEILIAASQKGCLDWPARFLHPLPENLLVRWLAPTPVTPNMVTLFTGLVGIAAGAAFATGWLWTALVLALITGPLDGVDGKLARTRVEFSKWGDLEHLLDKLLEYGWYLCAAWYFASVSGSALAWAIAALIIGPAIAEAVQGEFFRRLTGTQLDDAGVAERLQSGAVFQPAGRV